MRDPGSDSPSDPATPPPGGAERTVAPGGERPLFVLAGGWRSGSTLVQRLLCSHPEVRIWGESRGLLESLRAGWEAVEALQPLSAQSHAHWERDGHQGWIALANPPLERFREATRALFCTYWAAPAAAQGRPRWGFKEVRHGGGVARWLAELFPRARFAFVVRHPEACLASARGTTRGARGLLPEVGGPEAFVDHWLRTTRGLTEAAGTLPGMLLRYEDLVDDPKPRSAELARALELEPDGLDLSVFERKVRGWQGEPRLERADRRALRWAEVWEVAERLGYAPDAFAGGARRLAKRLRGGGRA